MRAEKQLRLTLTFDNGPDPEATPRVLDLLEKFDLRLTFFLIGRKVATRAGVALVERIKERHRIGNHTWTHSGYLGNMTADEALAEFELCQKQLDLVGVEDRLFRPLGGGRLGPHLLHRAVVDRLQQDKYTCVLWNLVAGDWRDEHGWLPRALEGVPKRDWTLLVLHDIAHGAVTHLEEFLKRMKDQGCQFVQEYPPDCVPIVEGRAALPLKNYCSG